MKWLSHVDYFGVRIIACLLQQSANLQRSCIPYMYTRLQRDTACKCMNGYAEYVSLVCLLQAARDVATEVQKMRVDHQQEKQQMSLWLESEKQGMLQWLESEKQQAVVYMNDALKQKDAECAKQITDACINAQL